MPTTWQRLGAVAPQGIPEVRLLMHRASHVVASVGKDLLPATPDSVQRSLEFLPGLKALASQPVPGAPPRRIALQIAARTLVCLGEGQQVLDTVSLEGHTLAEAMAWVNRALGSVRASLPEVTLLTYDDVPRDALAGGAPFPAGHRDAAAELERYFSNSHQALERVRAEHEMAGPIRIWPHHFDMATLLSLPAARDGTVRTVGAGFSPGDEFSSEPYWYVSPWPYPVEAELPDRDAEGRWQMEPWFGAVLKASALLASRASQKETVDAFFHRTIEISLALLEPEGEDEP